MSDQPQHLAAISDTAPAGPSRRQFATWVSGSSLLALAGCGGGGGRRP